MWDEIIYPFPNFNALTVEVWEWISNFISHFTWRVFTYPCMDQSYSMSVKGVPGSYDTIIKNEVLHASNSCEYFMGHTASETVKVTPIQSGSAECLTQRANMFKRQISN